MSSTLSSDNSSFSANRRSFLARALALSSAVAASGVITQEVMAAQNKAPNDKSKCAPDSVLIETETGATFEATLAPGSISQRIDPRLGTIVQLEIVLSTFAHKSLSVEKPVEQIKSLTLVHQELHRPQTALFIIGGNGGSFAGAVVNATAAYSLRLDDGTPVRAHMLLDVALLR